jgi:DNA-binding NarL/FixJ family response regulator
VLDGSSAIAKLHEHSYSLIIADIKMPGNSELEFIHLLPQIAPGVPVILVTGYPTLRSAVQSIQLPVVAYLTKPLEFDELLGQIQAVLAKSQADQTLRMMKHQAQELWQNLQNLERAIPLRRHGNSSIQASGLPFSYKEETYSDISTTTDMLERLRMLRELRALSVREWDVVRLLWGHQTVPTIAKSLFVSKHTVRNHLKSIFRKIGVHSQPALLEWLTKKSVEQSLRLLSAAAMLGLLSISA